MIKKDGNKLIRQFDKEILCIEPWGKNSLRVRATHLGKIYPNDEFALLEPVHTETQIIIKEKVASIQNGNIRCEISPSGKLSFYNQRSQLVLEEYDRNRFREADEGFNSALEVDPYTFEPHLGTDNFKLTVRFESCPNEKIFGMGQYQHPYLDLKGCILELAQRNSQASIPFALSSKGYGILWNNPAIGKVTFGKNITEWVAYSTRQMDYWVTVGDTPSEIVESYADVTGKVPMMPDYAMGFWQSKLRYQTQDELMEIAREYKRRGLPISVIVVDFFHWPHQGDWKFDTEYWPDPEGMIRELKEMGIELMVSIWPTVEKDSENFEEMEKRGLLTCSELGSRLVQLGNATFIDTTNPETRNYVWQKIKENYYDKGIRIFWLDEAEPEFTGYEFRLYRYHMGSNLEIGNIYPKSYAQMAYEGMRAQGQENIINLVRCAWAGSQRYGALVWSGDIDSSFRSLRNQLAAGLNMGIAGIPWWTTDIGGFHGGNIESLDFKECFVRWFQFGTFCPVFRLHGDREPHKSPLGLTGGGKVPSGADNEVWSYGEEVYEICKKYMLLREKLRPYIKLTMKAAHEKGTPVMRTLFYNFPDDKTCWEIEDEYMFGDDILVCPILYEKQRARKVYLPKGETWKDLFSGEEYEGGTFFECEAPIDKIPVFIKKGKLPELFQEI